MIPCIAGLLPEPYNSNVLELVYIVMHWHALAKLHMHTDSTLAVLDSTTTLLGTRLRQFATDCKSLDVRETQREYATRQRAILSRQRKHASPHAVNTPHSGIVASSQPNDPHSGRMRRPLNLNTIKIHALGDYVEHIRLFGTVDSTSTQLVRSLIMFNRSRTNRFQGEHEHRRLKCRYRRVSKLKSTGQIVKIDVRQRELRRMEQELRDIGIDIPNRTRSTSDDAPTLDKLHPRYHIAKKANARLFLAKWLPENSDDPAFMVRGLTPMY